MKMSMKKILALILAAMLAIAMAAAVGEEGAMEVEGPHGAAEDARPDLHPVQEIEEPAPEAPAPQEPAPEEPAPEPAPAEPAEEPVPAEPEQAPAEAEGEKDVQEETPAAAPEEGGEAGADQAGADEAAAAAGASGEEEVAQPQEGGSEGGAESGSEGESESASGEASADSSEESKPEEPAWVEFSMKFGDAKVTVTAKAGQACTIEKLTDEELEKAAEEALSLKEGEETRKITHLLLKITGDASEPLDVLVEHAGIKALKKANPDGKVIAKVIRMEETGAEAEAIQAKATEKKDEVSFQWTETGVYDLVLRVVPKKTEEEKRETTETDRSSENDGEETAEETVESGNAGEEGQEGIVADSTVTEDAETEEASEEPIGGDTGTGAADGAEEAAGEEETDGTEEPAGESEEADQPTELDGDEPAENEDDEAEASAEEKTPAAEESEAEESETEEPAEQEEPEDKSVAQEVGEAETVAENPGAEGTETAEPEVTEADATEAGVAEPEVTEPVVTEPVATEPEAAESEATEPVVTESEATEPEVTEPVAAEPEVKEPEATELEEPARPEVIIADAPFFDLEEEEEPGPSSPGEAVKEEEAEEEPEEVQKEEEVPAAEDGDEDLSIEELAEEELPAEEEPEPEEEEEVPFEQSAVVDGVCVTVSAEAGAFPAGSVLSVTRISASRQARVNSAVAQHRDEGEEVAASWFFDIKILSPEGVEIQPVDGKWVRVAFSQAGVADPNLKTQIFHMREDEGGLVAEELAVTEQGSTAEASTDGFSIYSLMLTYQVRPYTILAGASASMREVLSAVGLSGDPSEASLSGSGSNIALEGSNTDTWRIQAAAVPDEGTQSLMVTLNGISYQIPLNISGDAQKETGIQYRDELGLIQSWDGGYSVANTGSWQSSGGYTGWWVVEEDTTINQRVMVSGDVRLILTDGVTLTVNGGVQVAEGNKLTIYGQQLGTGMLKAVSYETTEDQPVETGAGIGGAYVENGRGNAGEIVIHGGHVVATAGMPGCAGIGGGTDGSATVTVTGGNVTATGNWNGPGIGGLGANTRVSILGGSVTGIGGLEGGDAITGQSGTAENGANGNTSADVIVAPTGEEEGPDSGPSTLAPGTTEAGYAPDGSVYTGQSVDYKTQGGSSGATYQWNSTNRSSHVSTGTNITKPTSTNSTSQSINSLLNSKSTTGVHIASAGSASGGPGGSDAIVVTRDETAEASLYNAILITLDQPYEGLTAAGAEEPTLWDTLSKLGASFMAHSADAEWSDTVTNLLDWGMQGMDPEVYPSLWSSPSAPVDGLDLVRVAGFTTPNESSQSPVTSSGGPGGDTEASSPLSPGTSSESGNTESSAEESPGGPGSADASDSTSAGTATSARSGRGGSIQEKLTGKQQDGDDTADRHSVGKATGNSALNGLLPEGLTGGSSRVSSAGSSGGPGAVTEASSDSEGPGGVGSAADTTASEGPGGAGAITGTADSEGPGGPGAATETAASEGPGGAGSLTVQTSSEGPGGPGAASDTANSEGPGGAGAVVTTDSEGPGGVGTVVTTDSEGPGGPGTVTETASEGPGGSGASAAQVAAAEEDRTDEEILSDAKNWMETSADELTQRGSRYFLQLKLAGPGPKGADESEGAYLARKLAWEDEVKTFVSWLQTSGRLSGTVLLCTVLNGEDGAAAPMVPMVMVHPDVAGGTVVTEATGHRDVLPTLVDLGRADETSRDLIKKTLPGKSLLTRVTLMEKESPASP